MQINNKQEKVYTLILECLEKIDNEIKLHQQGKSAESDEATLEQIKGELLKMKEVLSPKVFYPTYNYIIRDSWDFMNLGEELLSLYYKYTKIE